MPFRRPPFRSQRDPRLRGLESALRALAVAGPGPDFQVRLRARLLAACAVQPATASAARVPRRPRAWLPKAMTAGAAGIVGIAGIGVATSRALPLSGAERQVESWQPSAASGHAARGRAQLASARTRLLEVESLTQLPEPTGAEGAAAAGATAGRIASTLRQMDSATRNGTTDLVAAARGGDGQAAQELLAFVDEQSFRLSDLAPRLPGPAAAALHTSESVLRRVAALASTLPGAAAYPTATPAKGPVPRTRASAVQHGVRPDPVPVSAAPGPTTTPTGRPGAPTTLPPVTPTPSRPSGSPAAGSDNAPPWDAISGLLRGRASDAR